MAKIPAVEKLLRTDQRTVENAMSLIKAAQNGDRFTSQVMRENQAYLDAALDPAFVPKAKAHFSRLAAASRTQRAKL